MAVTFVFVLFFLNDMNVCVAMCVYVHVSRGVCKGQKTVSNLLELELQVLVSHFIWMQGTKIRFSEKALNP